MKKIQQDNSRYLNFLEWNKIFMVAEDNPNGLHKYKDSPTQLANKLPGANKSFTKKKHSV
jgi:hypothetical protein